MRCFVNIYLWCGDVANWIHASRFCICDICYAEFSEIK